MPWLPNALASLRIVLAPLVVWLVLAGENPGLSAATFAVAATTDFFDGYLARKWDVTSTLGGFLDSTADKLLVIGSLLALIAVDRASVWVVLIIVMREFIVTALRSLTAIDGTIVPPSIWGKLKASMQFVAIFVAILRPGSPIGGLFIDEWLLWAAAVVTILSGWGYLKAFMAHVRRASSTS